MIQQPIGAVVMEDRLHTGTWNYFGVQLERSVSAFRSCPWN